MQLIIADDYLQLSKLAALQVVELMGSSAHPLICTASGDSPAGTYKELVRLVAKEQANLSSWNFVGLDEWVGLNGNDEGSCRFHLNKQLFLPLHVTQERISFFDGRAGDLDAECKKVDDYIKTHHGLDVMIAGLGMNGHIGMNEPGSDPALHAHVSELDPLTQEVGQKYFSKEQLLTGGITLGIANFMETKHVFLLVNGRRKAAIVKQLIEGEISTRLPGSLLRRHPSLTIFLDRESASLLK